MAKGPSELRQMQAMMGKYLNEISDLKRDVSDLKRRLQRLEKHLSIKDEDVVPSVTSCGSPLPSLMKINVTTTGGNGVTK